MTKPRTRTGGRGGAGGHEPADVIAARAERAWDLMLLGASQRDIATELGVSQPAVSKMLRREAERHAADLTDEDAQRARQIAKCDHVYRESMKAYGSQQTETRRRQRQTTDEEGNPGPTSIEADVLSRDHDPRFLDTAMRALDRKSHLLGLHKGPGRTRARRGEDPDVARERLASRLDRLASGRPRVPQQPE